MSSSKDILRTYLFYGFPAQVTLIFLLLGGGRPVLAAIWVFTMAISFIGVFLAMDNQK